MLSFEFLLGKGLVSGRLVHACESPVLVEDLVPRQKKINSTSLLYLLNPTYGLVLA